jgi:hypothetical protein
MLMQISQLNLPTSVVENVKKRMEAMTGKQIKGTYRRGIYMSGEFILTYKIVENRKEEDPYFELMDLTKPDTKSEI